MSFSWSGDNLNTTLLDALGLVVLASLGVAGLVGQAASENKGHKLGKKMAFSIWNLESLRFKLPQQRSRLDQRT